MQINKNDIELYVNGEPQTIALLSHQDRHIVVRVVSQYLALGVN